MNKILIALLVLGVGALGYYILQGRSVDVSEDFSIEEGVSLEEVEQALKDDGDGKIKGSCNAIPEASTCLEYRGSMWEDYNSAQLNCEGAGTFSSNGCPYTEYGGCRTSAGTVMETVLWMYPEGGGGFDDESIQYARAACEANPHGTWVIPNDLM